ncbi:MAG: 30S ribosomal protein S2, partial [Aurantimicrobium sp.]
MTYPLPGNDDASRSVGLLTRVIADAVAEGLIQRHQKPAEGESAEPLAEWERELLEAGAEAAVEAAVVEAVAEVVAEEVVAEAAAEKKPAAKKAAAPKADAAEKKPAAKKPAAKKPAAE